MDILDNLMKRNGISKTWITDTARNGNDYMRYGVDACR